jgi:hypothetical protein
MLCVYASEVAKLIGKNPFESRNAALLTVLARSKTWHSGVVAKVRQELGVRTDQQVLAEASADPDTSNALKQGVSAACAASTPEQVSSAVCAALDAIHDTEKRKCMESEAVDIVKKKLKRDDVSIGEAMDALKSDPDLLALAQKRASEKTQASMSVLKPVVEASVIKERGTRMEAAVLDTYEAAHATKVGMRNDKRMHLRAATYTITGCIDGFDELKSQIIEVKNRRRLWARVPEYDIIQVRVYLAILASCKDVPLLSGKLVERFPGGDVRETLVPHCLEEWARIDSELTALAERVQTMTEDSIRDLF